MSHARKDAMFAALAKRCAALERELAAERARPRPRVAWSTDVGCLDAYRVLSPIGHAQGTIEVFDDGVQAAWGDEEEKDYASLAEARAAIEAAAEADGFDVSACREKP